MIKNRFKDWSQSSPTAEDFIFLRMSCELNLIYTEYLRFIYMYYVYQIIKLSKVNANEEV